MSLLQFHWIYDKNKPIVLREFLQEKKISKQALTDIKFKGGKIEVNGKEVTVRYLLQENDCVSITFPREEISETLLVECGKINILHEDDYFLIINKPAEMNTIPSREWPTSSLANHILGYYKKIRLSSSIHMVNRLDRDTSGALIVAKYRHVHHLFSLQQKNIEVKRRYIALVHGKIAEKKGTISVPIGRKLDSIIEREVRDDGQHAVTHYEVLCQNDEYTLLSIVLETGRTHQIRVHFSHIGHPLVGDDLYNGKTDVITRQVLHSYEIEGIHPVTSNKFSYIAPIPEDLDCIFQELFSKEYSKALK